LSKDRILELYLNLVEWGPGVFGAEAAARYYFGKSASKLTAEQAATLAATLPHPLTSNPKQKPGRMAWRKRMILARMGVQGPVQTVPLEPPRPQSDSLMPLDSIVPDTVLVDSLRSDTLPPVKRDTVRRDTLPVQTDTVRRDTLRPAVTPRSMATSSAN
ncbi:MAG TPA: biosynthetic peptidoglycan transglycosylase, partial [Longimicrobiales bacterium]|nr:biosynthetic peptidoglycan transglycosylase [Longimicrobiales bacterium]